MYTGKSLPDLLAEGLQLWLKGPDQLGFKAPRGKLSPELKEKLIAAKPELLVTLERNRKYAACSFAQHRLWFLEQLDGANPVYNIHATHMLEGELNVEALQNSITKVLQRHDSLRTVFDAADGQPFQVIADSVEFELQQTDLTAVEESLRDEAIEHHLQKAAVDTFDLQQGPLIRFSLYKLSDTRHAFMILTHHIIFDGISLGLLINELSASYEALISGKEPDLPQLQSSYADHVSWQRQWFSGDVAQKQLDYWKNKLAGDLESLNLPLDYQRPQIQDTSGDILFSEIPQELLNRLDATAKQHKVSLFMLLVTAVNVLLSRYCSQDDILLGLPVANRSRKKVESTVGYFANTLVLRTNLADEPTFAEMLQRVRTVCLDAYNHEDAPFEQVVSAVQPAQDRSRTPLFQAMVSYDEAVNHARKLGEVTMERMPIRSRAARTDLTIWMSKEIDSIRFAFEYATKLFRPETIRRMMDGFLALLEAVVLDTSLPISILPVITAENKHQLLREWNQTQADVPTNCCFHQLFEEKAKEKPGQIAASFNGSQINYDELNKAANRLANLLIGYGIESGDLLGICMDRSLSMLIGLLAAQKIGATYIPMDPSFPVDRLQYMCEDADVKCILSETVYGELVSGFSGEQVFYDQLEEELMQQPDRNLDIRISPTAAMYMIYTSGSTGRPKGALLPHSAVVNFLNSMSKSPGVQASDRLLAITTLSFDIAVLELYLPLMQGACVVIADSKTVMDPPSLKLLLSNENITVMQATPTTWRMLLETSWNPPPQFKALCGGEAMPQSLCNSLLKKGVELWNMYGPTETCVWSCVQRMQPEHDRILIGRPIDNTTIYILDKHLNPVPQGVAGDLWIGGVGLALGYHNRPELTVERFIDNPFSSEPDSRLYKTGDLARYVADETLECLGRDDFQIKIRGYRIEPGEIEVALKSYSGIEQAVVTVKTFSEDDERLVGYVISENQIEEQLQSIRQHMKEALPDYMIPAAIMQLDTIPLTPNGKIDRNALPLPQPKVSTIPIEVKRPVTKLEAKLIAIWESVLMAKSIGVNDNFFEIGGHSLLAARIFARIESELGKKLPLATLFTVQTIAGLAAAMQEETVSSDWSSLVPIQTSGDRPPLFLIHGAGGNVLLYRDLAHYLGDDQPVYGLQAQGLDGSMNYLTRFEEMAERYISEIRAQQPSGPYYLGGYCLGGTLAFEVAKQLTSVGEQVALVAMFETFNIHVLNKKVHSKPYQILHKMQNWKFHFENLMALDAKSRADFFLEKARVERSRAKASLEVGVNNLFRKLGRANLVEDKPAPVILDPINDRAQYHYVPTPYSGRITLFQPVKSFAGFEDEFSGWSGLAEGGIDLQEMPLRPRGMMVEPFVKLLAEKLNVCISKSRRTYFAQETNDPKKTGMSDEAR
ncbi:MAG: amino acid adenylation domain-containing protein [Calditrichia bacterium]